MSWTAQNRTGVDVRVAGETRHYDNSVSADTLMQLAGEYGIQHFRVLHDGVEVSAGHFPVSSGTIEIIRDDKLA